jgi:hypothetical protein
LGSQLKEFFSERVAWLAEVFAGVPGWNHEDAAAEPR